MTRNTWDVGEFIGQDAHIKLVDSSSEEWGHINFDDLEGDMICPVIGNSAVIVVVGFCYSPVVDNLPLKVSYEAQQ